MFKHAVILSITEQAQDIFMSHFSPQFSVQFNWGFDQIPLGNINNVTNTNL